MDTLNYKIVKPTDQIEWKRCERFEYEIFVKSKYIEKNREKKIPQYNQYDHSVFLAIFPEERKKKRADITIAGVMRIFYEPHADKMREGLFPILDVYNRAELYPDKLELLMSLDPRDTINIGAMVLNEKYRTLDSFMTILAAFFIFCCQHRYLYGFASLENFVLYDTLKKYFTVIDMGPKLPFRGAPSILTIIDIFDQLETPATQSPAS